LIAPAHTCSSILESLPTPWLGIEMARPLLLFISTNPKFRAILFILTNKIMRLYATVASERATKRQGGNDYVEIELTVEREGTKEQITFDRLTLKQKDDFYVLSSEATKQDIAQVYAIDHDPRTCELSSPCFECFMTERGVHAPKGELL
jgi:hypothetical protein